MLRRVLSRVISHEPFVGRSHPRRCAHLLAKPALFRDDWGGVPPDLWAKLPLALPVAGEDPLILNWLQEPDYQTVYKIYNKASTAGQGFGIDEFPTYEAFDKRVLSEPLRFVVHGNKSNVLAGFICMVPDFVRSTSPVNTCGYMFMPESVRSKSLGQHLINSFVNVINPDIGFRGSVLRMSVLNSIALMMAHRTGYRKVAILPNSTLHPKFGPTDDILVYIRIDKIADSKNRTSFSGDLPPLNVDLVRAQQEALSQATEDAKLYSSDRIDVRLVCDTDTMLQAETLIRDAANAGQGFGIDEFNSDGTFSRKVVDGPKTYVAKLKDAPIDKDGEVVATIVIGRSRLCRGDENPSAIVYLAINDAYRNHGLDGELVGVAETIAADTGFKEILTDVYSCDASSMELFARNGYYLTGSIPESGVVKGKGLTSTVLFHKFLKNVS